MLKYSGKTVIEDEPLSDGSDREDEMEEVVPRPKKPRLEISPSTLTSNGLFRVTFVDMPNYSEEYRTLAMEMLGKSHGRGWGIDKNCIEVQADILNVHYLTVLADRFNVITEEIRDEESEQWGGNEENSGNESEGEDNDGGEITIRTVYSQDPPPILVPSPSHISPLFTPSFPPMNLSSLLKDLPSSVVAKIHPWTEGTVNRGCIKMRRPMATRVGIAAMLSGLSPSSGLIICLAQKQDYREVQRILMDSLVSCTSTPFALLIAQRSISEISRSKFVSFMTGEEDRKSVV